MIDAYIYACISIYWFKVGEEWDEEQVWKIIVIFILHFLVATSARRGNLRRVLFLLGGISLCSLCILRFMGARFGLWIFGWRRRKGRRLPIAAAWGLMYCWSARDRCRCSEVYHRRTKGLLEECLSYSAASDLPI